MEEKIGRELAILQGQLDAEGLTGRFSAATLIGNPQNILIGQVVDAQPIEFGFATVARVRLAARLDNLEEVWVITE